MKESLLESDALINEMLSSVDAEKSRATVESDRLSAHSLPFLGAEFRRDDPQHAARSRNRLRDFHFEDSEGRRRPLQLFRAREALRVLAAGGHDHLATET